MQKIIAEIARTLGRAVVAGVGVELARLASRALRKRLDPDDDEVHKKDPPAREQTPEELKAELERLKAENERLKTELTHRTPT